MALRFTCAFRRDDEVILRVNPAALDRAFAATDSEFHASVHDGKVDELMQPIDEPIKAPIVGACDGQIYFVNGRHRARAAMRLGLRVIPIVVDHDNAAEVRALLERFK